MWPDSVDGARFAAPTLTRAWARRTLKSYMLSTTVNNLA